MGDYVIYIKISAKILGKLTTFYLIIEYIFNFL